MKLKKIIWILVVCVVLLFAFSFIGKYLIGGMIWEHKLQGTYTVYTVVEEQGVKENDSEGDSEFNNYLYKTTGVTEEGKEMQLEFYGTNGEEIKAGTYLKIAYDDDRGVVTWSFIDANDVPSALKEKLDK